ALAAIGDASARPALADAFANERYVHMRGPEARALAKLGAKDDLRVPLARFAGLPDPMAEAIEIAEQANLLEPRRGGWGAPGPTKSAPKKTSRPSPRTPPRRRPRSPSRRKRRPRRRPTRTPTK